MMRRKSCALRHDTEIDNNRHLKKKMTIREINEKISTTREKGKNIDNKRNKIKQIEWVKQGEREEKEKERKRNGL
jgi:hypothetical protein